MSKRMIGLVIFVLGVALAAVSLAADYMGIGVGPGIGLKQLAGTVLGVVAGVAGAWIAKSKKTG